MALVPVRDGLSAGETHSDCWRKRGGDGWHYRQLQKVLSTHLWGSVPGPWETSVFPLWVSFMSVFLCLLSIPAPPTQFSIATPNPTLHDFPVKVLKSLKRDS